MEHKLDNIDRKIIEMLQKNARTPVKEIAKEVFLSSPAVSARIEHLEKNGLILSYSGSETLGRKRTYFHITPDGKRYFREKCGEWAETKKLIDCFTAAPSLPAPQEALPIENVLSNTTGKELHHE